MSSKFDYTLDDAQATKVEPISFEHFDFAEYEAYEAMLMPNMSAFWSAKSGMLVYRRMRVAEVFSYGCRDMAHSLACQLGALKQSMAYKADIPNFLEPWYGIGIVASAYGINYEWNANQAPAVIPKFQTVKEALDYDPVPVAETAIGKHTLEMIDFFLDKTQGRLPISLTDTQSPLNTACNIVDSTNLFMAMLDDPDSVKTLLDRIADLLVDFTKEQVRRIKDALTWPGHGFASSRAFSSIGFSDDNMVMLSDVLYRNLAMPSLEKAGAQFDNPTFHSCGNWSRKIDMVKSIKGLRMVDGAFSLETDPDPNPPEPFREGFANSNIVLNARIVGSQDCVVRTVEKLWHDNCKLIVVTYCPTIEEQSSVYDRVHDICRTASTAGH